MNTCQQCGSKLTLSQRDNGVSIVGCPDCARRYIRLAIQLFGVQEVNRLQKLGAALSPEEQAAHLRRFKETGGVDLAGVVDMWKET